MQTDSLLVVWSEVIWHRPTQLLFLLPNLTNFVVASLLRNNIHFIQTKVTSAVLSFIIRTVINLKILYLYLYCVIFRVSLILLSCWGSFFRLLGPNNVLLNLDLNSCCTSNCLSVLSIELTIRQMIQEPKQHHACQQPQAKPFVSINCNANSLGEKKCIAASQQKKT